MKSKLPVIASYADASEGLITHGWITNIENHGCFVRFYNGVQGFAHRLVFLLLLSIFRNDVRFSSVKHILDAGVSFCW